MEPEAGEPGVAWRQSLGAGLLLGLALGCAWLAHWTPRLYPRLLLVGLAALLALLGLAFMVTLSERWGWAAEWQRKLEAQYAEAGLPFFSVLVVLALAAFTTGNNLLYLVVSGLLAALLVSSLASALNLSGMELRFRLPEEIFAGQTATVRFTLTNAKGFWPAYALEVRAASQALVPGNGARRMGAPAEATMRPAYFSYLRRRQSAHATSEIAYPRRGRYAATAFVLSTGFPFGILQKHRRFKAGGREPETLVYPAPAGAPNLAARLRAAAGPLPRLQRGEGPELYRIRGHQTGDSARQVHWKATARAGALRVREFSDESAPRLRLRLALPPHLGPERAEAALSECAACVLELSRPDLWLEFVGQNTASAASDGLTRGLYLALAPAPNHRRAILDYLALLDTALPLAPAPRDLDPDLAEIAIEH